MKKILVVVDIQNDFVDGALGTREAVAIIDNAVQKIKNFDGDIFVTLDTHYENYMQTLEGQKLPMPHCIKNTNGWLLNPKIADALKNRNYKTVEKLTFGSTELPQLIKETIGDNQAEITLIGLCTDICVVSNALLLKANFTDAEIYVDSSCCAGVTPETHNAALEVMKSNLIEVEYDD